jgi:hypothetical protein
MEGLLVWPLFLRSLDYFFQAINPFWLIHSSRRPQPFPLFYLQGDAQIRRRGPKPNRNKEEIIAEFMVFEAGEGVAPSSEKQRLFRAYACKREEPNPKHMRILNPHSIQSRMTPVCKVCNGKEDLEALAKGNPFMLHATCLHSNASL